MNLSKFGFKRSKIALVMTIKLCCKIFGHWSRCTDRTISRCSDARLTILHTSYWSVIDRFAAVQELSLNCLKDFATKLKATFRMDCLVQGNYSKEQALQVARDLKSKLQPKEVASADLPPIRICQVPRGEICCRLASFHSSDSNSVVTNYYQCGATNIRQSSVMEILTVLFFTEKISSIIID